MKTQLCADVGDYRGFYKALKAVYGHTHQVQSPLRGSEGQDLLTDNTSILARWSEHFQTLFSANRTVYDTAIDRVPELPLKEELDEPPTLEELTETIEQLKSRKAAGVDGIPPEIWKHGGPALYVKLHDLLVCCWEQGRLPQDLRDAVIITLYKDKGEKSLTAPIIGGSPYFPSLAKYLPGSCSTGSFQPLLKKSAPRASAASEPPEARWTWCSSSANFRRSAANKTRISMLLLLTLQKHLTR